MLELLAGPNKWNEKKPSDFLNLRHEFFQWVLKCAGVSF